MAWLKVTFVVARDSVDSVSQSLHQAGAIALSLFDAGSDAILETDGQTMTLWSDVRMEALLNIGTSLQPIRSTLAKHGAKDLTVSFVQEMEWENVWRGHSTHKQFGRLHVLPRESPAEVKGPLVRLDPGLAFGTGEHATTAMCLNWLENINLDGKSVLDFGCGSGILGLAASKFGAASVEAVDHGRLRARLPGHVEDDVGAHAGAEHDPAVLRRMGCDRVAVERDDLRPVALELQAEDPRIRGVDEAEPDALAPAHGELSRTGAVDGGPIAETPGMAHVVGVVEAGGKLRFLRHPPVVQHPGQVPVHAERRAAFLDDQHAVKAARDLFHAVGMGVVPEGSGIQGVELVGEGPAGADRRLPSGCRRAPARGE